MLCRRFVRNNHDLWSRKLDANSCFSNIRLQTSDKVTVFALDLAPSPSTPIKTSGEHRKVNNFTESTPNKKTTVFEVFEISPFLEKL